MSAPLGFAVMPPEKLVLFPGAGGDRSHHTLVALQDGLSQVEVHRRDFSYRATRKGPPDRPPKLVEDVRREVRSLHPRDAVPVVIGGRSMGGRIASMAVAQGVAAGGLVLLSYPLHPPGRPEKLRVAHFGSIDVPCLFVSGTRDPFGTPGELTAAVAEIPAPVRVEWLDGERHDPVDRDDQIVGIVADWIAAL